MGYTDLKSDEQEAAEDPTAEAGDGRRPRRHNWLLHIVLFLLTLASTTYSALTFILPATTASWDDVVAHLDQAFLFSGLLMFFLTAHEFGHYFAARYHRVDATLPFYIPMPFVPFGTLGAVIRTRSAVPSRRAMFDIGVAGPIAGFVVALAYLVIGMATVPGIESLYGIHPEYRLLAALPDHGLHFGGFLLFDILKAIFIEPGQFFPPMNEVYHYPFLAVGWFGMFVTALNMIPVGQLDGGHVIYGMFGRYQPAISRWFVRFITFAGLGGVGLLLLEATRSYNSDSLFQFLQSIFGPAMEWIAEHASWWFTGWFGWLFWVLILRFLVRIEHPPTLDESPLDRKRMIVGWIALAILVLTFSWTGIYDNPMAEPGPAPQPPVQQQPKVPGGVEV